MATVPVLITETRVIGSVKEVTVSSCTVDKIR